MLHFNIGYEDIKELVPEATKSAVLKFNERLEGLLRQRGYLKECVEHKPRFLKLAHISGQEFELNQYGFMCDVCEKRIFPVKFELFDIQKHSGKHIRRPHMNGHEGPQKKT